MGREERLKRLFALLDSLRLLGVKFKKKPSSDLEILYHKTYKRAHAIQHFMRKKAGISMFRWHSIKDDLELLGYYKNKGVTLKMKPSTDEEKDYGRVYRRLWNKGAIATIATNDVNDTLDEGTDQWIASILNDDFDHFRCST